MKILTKYNIDDSVWIISGGKAEQRRVCLIDIEISPANNITDSHHIKINYKVNAVGRNDGEFWARFDEPELFSTKEELIESL